MARHVCIHGHFYQPPRENPWLERVEVQAGASPYHDWNHRITAECYAPNAASRIIDPQGKILAIMNNYALISFNFGPTLLSWMEREVPDVYRSVLEADVKSRSNFSGHGSAMAQPYNHIIMPLANRRDKRTQVIWGVRDFIHRFQRSPEGMWLPETAVDIETLEIMAGAGIKFTILAPHQAHSFRSMEGGEWTEVAEGGIDTRRPYLCRLPSGRSISIFFYDQGISGAVAFSNLLKSGEEFARTIMAAFSEGVEGDQLVSVATDGETYGHHHKFGEMALSYCLHQIGESGQARLTNYGEYLSRNPPTNEVKIKENTSWSCPHGVGRWQEDCGCSVSGEASGRWRKPLRDAMDWLRDSLATVYESEASKYLADPWGARDDYITVVLDRRRENVEAFLEEHRARNLSPADEIAALRLLEMQRNSMLMYTSCGWYFDDISGIEAIQVVRYAARAIQLAGQVSGVDLEPGFLERLRLARSGRGALESGVEIYLRSVKPEITDLAKVGVHYAVSSIFNGHAQGETRVYSYAISDELFFPMKVGMSALLMGRSRITSEITWESQVVSYAVLWLGGNMIYGGARSDMGVEEFKIARSELKPVFESGEIHRVIACIGERFGAAGCAPCSLRELFNDKQVEVINKILGAHLERAMDFYSQIYNDGRSSMQALADLGVKPPIELQAAAEVVFTKEIVALLGKEEVDIPRLEAAVAEMKKTRMELGRELIALEAQRRIEAEVDSLSREPLSTQGAANLERLIALLMETGIPMNLWRAQNKWYSFVATLKSNHHGELYKAPLTPWAESIHRISEFLRVRI